MPDYTALARRGERRRTARQAVTAGVAVLTVTGVVGLSQVVAGPGDNRPQPAPAPEPTTELPSGGEPTILPSWRDGTLHVGDVTVETDLRNIRYGGGTTVVGTQYGEDAAWYLVDGPELVPVVETGNAVSEVVVSPDGTLVAYAEVLPGDEGFRVALWDAEDHVELDATVRGPDSAATGELFLDGFDLDGRLFFVDDAVRMWSAGTEPVTVGVEATLNRAQPWPGGLMYEEWEQGQDLPGRRLRHRRRLGRLPGGGPGPERADRPLVAGRWDLRVQRVACGPGGVRPRRRGRRVGAPVGCRAGPTAAARRPVAARRVGVAHAGRARRSRRGARSVRPATGRVAGALRRGRPRLHADRRRPCRSDDLGGSRHLGRLTRPR
ncbi:hypothetical protein [Nocardioides sp. TF02-7]|uniref:hypothetical protein n=1 Tax=Nocardioides sp. TF02-7 TaxID=2917724 RepID=UPI001F06812E|nr:hypothetical protein [Nocardioides sp. TF02-7]UMG93241.1 hypothetical protein MF408_02805 [Nocardioides sp. TF02-7]